MKIKIDFLKDDNLLIFIDVKDKFRNDPEENMCKN